MNRIIRLTRVHIGRVIVHPNIQNRGIGTQLMEKIEGRFKEARRFELFTGSENEKTLYFYQKPGYRIFKTEVIHERLSFACMEKKRQAG